MRSYFRSDQFWALLLAFVFFFLVGTMNAHGQTSDPISLPTIIEYAQSLETRLISREAQAKAQVIYWQNIVSALTKENESDKKHSTELSEALTKAQAELSKSQTAYAEIVSLLSLSDQAFSDYKSTSEKQIKALELELRFYKVAGKSAITVATLSLAVSATYILGDRLEWW